MTVDVQQVAKAFDFMAGVQYGAGIFSQFPTADTKRGRRQDTVAPLST
jgi:hypothetical protein